MSEYKYDVALSFAGEDRNYVDEVAENLKLLGVSVFYDSFETINLWGKDLYQYLNDVYINKACYCVIFISEHYKNKLWTNHELKSSQVRAFEEKREYILPARFDLNIEIPGINETIGYIDLNKYTPENFAKIICEKIRNGLPLITDAPIDTTKTFKNSIVSILSLANNKYLGADIDQPNTPIFAHRPISELWEQFEIEITQDGWAAFRACNNGKYISAWADSPNCPLFASATTIQTRECFRIYSYRRNFLLQAQVNSRYIMVDIARSISPGNVGLFACANIAQEGEQFQLEVIDKNDVV